MAGWISLPARGLPPLEVQGAVVGDYHRQVSLVWLEDGNGVLWNTIGLRIKRLALSTGFITGLVVVGHSVLGKVVKDIQ